MESNDTNKKYTITIGRLTTDIEPEILYIDSDISEIEPVIVDGLSFPVVGCCRVKYNNAMNIDYTRVHNVYKTDEDGYFILLFDQKIPLGELDEYRIMPGYKTVARYTLHNLYYTIMQ